MKMSMDQTKRETLWLALFLVIPVVFFTTLPRPFFEDASTHLLMTSILGAVGGGIGFLLFWFTHKKSNVWKIGMVTTLFITATGVTYGVNQYDNALIVCDVCGDQVDDQGTHTECDNCSALTWKYEATFDADSSKEIWLMEEQLYFVVPTPSDPIGLIQPKERAGDHRNANRNSNRNQRVNIRSKVTCLTE